MSKRRKQGDTVLARIEDGVHGVGPILAVIAGPRKEQRWHECDDPDCREWCTLHGVDKYGKETGIALYHVSECEMSDPPAGR